jgi:hypothetical protein
MKKLIILASLLIVASNLIIAKQRSTRKNLKQSETTVVEPSQPSIYADTICGDTVAKIITISGYEKPLRSRHETMLVTNNDSARTVTTLTLNITYSDMQGRTLHSRTVTSSLTVPPLSTRLLDLKSWDVNTLFYYHVNPPVRTSSQATPYRVTITPTSLTSTH